jgi:hypothetical protein
MAETPKEITVAFKEVPGRPVIPVTGGHGGPSPDGYVVFVHLYNEFATLPANEVYPVSAAAEVDFTKGKPAKRESEVTRMVVATLVLSPETAIKTGAWLIKQGEEARKHRQQNQPKVKVKSE